MPYRKERKRAESSPDFCFAVRVRLRPRRDCIDLDQNALNRSIIIRADERRRYFGHNSMFCIGWIR
jgi:hypothetical protein